MNDVIAEVGPRLRALRIDRGLSLAELSTRTGISASTLSRLESGLRRLTLEQLLPLAREHGVPLDDLVGAPMTGDPRIHIRPVKRNGMTMLPLGRGPGDVYAFKHIIPPTARRTPELQRHEGYEWMYVLSGSLRVILGDRDVIMGPGEAAEFDTRTPHWFGPAGDEPVEFISLFSRQGERVHVSPA